MAHLRRFIYDEEGQDLVEYALLLTLVSTICFLVIISFGTKISAMFAGVAPKLPSS